MSATDTTVTVERELKCPIGRVWQALTDSATLSQWMFFETNDFRPVVGHKFQFRGKESTGWTAAIDCEVLEADAPNRLSYTWATQGFTGGVHQTTVTWTLSESAGGVTRLQLEQSGFQSDQKQEIGGAQYGWTHQLGKLQELLDAQ